MSRKTSNLEHSKWQVRVRSLRQLARLETEALLEYAGSVTALLDDEHWQVRQAALEVLAKLQPVAISTSQVLVKLSDHNLQVRRSALQALSHLHPEGFDACAHILVQRLNDDSVLVRLEALKLLRKLTHAMRKIFIKDVANRMGDDDGTMRRESMLMLGEIVTTEISLRKGEGHPSTVMHESADYSETKDHHTFNEKQTDTCDEVVSSNGIDCSVERSPPVDANLGIASHLASPRVERNTSANESSSAPEAIIMALMRRDVVHMLCTIFMCGERSMDKELQDYVSVDTHLLDQACSQVADSAASNTLLHLACEHNCLSLVHVLLTEKHSMLHAKNAFGDTPLHLAAESGHLDVCRRLVSAGALTKANNKRKLTPADLAGQNKHAAVVTFLESQQNLTTVRGGIGDALLEAVADERPITKVDWYKIYLPGLAGRVGAFHSLLAITIGSAETSHTYVLEKAAVARSAGQEDGEQVKNGVHVSHWLDVVPNVEHDPILSLDSIDIENNTGVTSFCMRTLREIAVDLGPYNVATCNCHHAALAVYNACAKDTARVPRIPNFGLVLGARFLQGVGVDIAGSDSVASRSVCVNSESAASTSTSGAALQSGKPDVLMLSSSGAPLAHTKNEASSDNATKESH